MEKRIFKGYGSTATIEHTGGLFRLTIKDGMGIWKSGEYATEKGSMIALHKAGEWQEVKEERHNG